MSHADGTTHRTSPGDAWPRNAVPLSAVVVLVGLAMTAFGLSRALDRSTGYAAATVVFALLAAVVYGLAVTFIINAFLGERLSSSLRGAVFTISIVVAVALFVLSRFDRWEPFAVTVLGAAIVGCMVANIAGIRRARRVEA